MLTDNVDVEYDRTRKSNTGDNIFPPLGKGGERRVGASEGEDSGRERVRGRDGGAGCV